MVVYTHKETYVLPICKNDEHNNKFSKGWFPGSKKLNGKEISNLPTIGIYLSDQPFNIEDIFVAIVTFSPRGTPIGIMNYYCENNNMNYITQ